MKGQQPLAGRVALVTGAARGLGAAVAGRCAASGAAVLVADADEAGASRVADTIRERGGRAESVGADITVAADVAHAVDAARELGPLRALVLAATTEARGALVDCTDDEWKRVLDGDLKGPFLCLRAAVPAIRDAGGGSIVAVGSSIGLAPNRVQVANAAAAGALVNLCKQVAIEHAPDNVRVNVVARSAVDRDSLAAVCDAVTFLLSDAAEHTSGAVIPVAGGLASPRPEK